MRTAFAHNAVVTMASDADEAALGAAITVELCGHWEHEPPCPLAPHHTGAVRADGDEVHVRVLFVTEPGNEAEVRRRIGTALANGSLNGPTGPVSWSLERCAASDVHESERAHAARMAGS